jgi:hypothetical protein
VEEAEDEVEALGEAVLAAQAVLEAALEAEFPWVVEALEVCLWVEFPSVVVVLSDDPHMVILMELDTLQSAQ